MIRIRVLDQSYAVVNVSNGLIENDDLFENILTNVSAYEHIFEVTFLDFVGCINSYKLICSAIFMLPKWPFFRFYLVMHD